MNISYVATVLRQMGISVDTHTRAKNVYIACPLARWTHSSGVDTSGGFSISVDFANKSPCRCWNNKCGFSGNIYTLCKEFTRLSGQFIDLPNGDVDPNDVLEFLSEKTIDDSWKEYIEPYTMPYRFLTEDDVARYEIMYHTQHKRIVFPVFDIFHDELLGGIGRSTPDTHYKQNIKYWNYGYFRKTEHLFMQHSQAHKQCILAEGPMDCLSIKRVAEEWDVFAIMGAALSAQQADLLSGYKKILCMFDNDAAGRQATISVLNNVAPLTQVYVPSSTLVAKDPGDAEVDELQNTITRCVIIQR